MAFDRDAEPHNLTTAERDQRIRERRLAGESLSALAREYGISPQRVHQIISDNRSAHQWKSRSASTQRSIPTATKEKLT